MQKVIFSNKKTINADEIQGSNYNGRETLVFIISGENTTFEELKNIFIDKEATETIMIEYENTDGFTQQNLQVGFIVPVSLSYAVDTYSMTLGKQTQVEADYAALRSDITELVETVEQIKHELENLSKK